MKPITLKTKHLVLRRSQEQDAEILFMNYLSLPERSYFLSRNPYKNIDQAKDFLTLWCDLPWEKEKNKFAWVIANANENKAMGLFLIILDDNQDIEIHYGISKEFDNKGFITEAGEAVIEWLSSQTDVKKIYAHCDLENIASQAVLNKLGLKKMGVLKSHLILPAFGSSPRDCFYFERLIP